MIICDCHNHTDLSADCQVPAETMIEAAVKKGLSYLCITDHMDPDMDFPGMDFTFSLPDYFARNKKLKERYSKKINLLTGIELGLQPHISEKLSRIVSYGDFDFVIGSAHVCDEMDPYFPAYWENRTERDGIFRYFEYILETISAFDDIDVYGHIDYIVRYAPSKSSSYSYRSFAEILDEILKTFISKNIGLELNTAGLKYGLGFVHPHPDILKRYRELGGEILTIGSDAHKPEHLAYEFSVVPDLLKQCGFRYYTFFQNRKPEFIKL